MAKSKGQPKFPEWVRERLAAIGPFTVEAWAGEFTCTFASLPELATNWCQFALDIAVPFDPTPEVIDQLLERWQWYCPRHRSDSKLFRAAVIELYRECDDFEPRDLSDADILAQVTRARIEVATLAARDYELYAEVFVQFAGEHSPLLAWDESLPGWDQIA